jgi:hypothetical protein
MSQSQAVRLFKRFFDREPEHDEIVSVVMRRPTTALVIGELDSVIYRTEGEAKPMFHRFKKNDRPLLLVSSDGRQIYTIKGSYRFTEKGFEG